MQFRDLKQQHRALQPQLDEAVKKVMADCNFISGVQVNELEARLAQYVGVKHCITCANGTDALKLAEMAYGIGPGDAVFIPDFTFFSTAETVAELGAMPIFVDVDANTFNISAAELETAIARIEAKGTLRPRAVVAVDLFGQCADFPKIEAIAKKHDLLVIEDGAQSFGGRVGKRRACSFGDIATTSFFPAKPLGCYGDGGAVFTNDDDINALVRSYCVHGKGSTDKYDNVRIGMNSRLDTIQAAILDVKLDAFIKYELEDVNKIATMYTEYLSEIVKTPSTPDGFYSSWAQYTIKLTNNMKRNEVRAVLKERAIPTMVYYSKCMHQQRAFAHMLYNGECPVSESLCDTVLQLPIHPYLTEDEVRVISQSLRDSLLLQS